MRYRKIEGGEKLSLFITPMLAQLTDKPAFDSEDWIFEIKWDGYRAIAELNGKTTLLYSRNGLSFAKSYRRVYEALQSLKLKAILDGEIIVFDENDKPNFQKLQNFDNHQKTVIAYFVFDCLELNGKDITTLPLLERKRLLKEHLPENSIIRYCDHVQENGIALYQQVQEQQLEGIIAKRVSSRYLPGKRTSEWLKIKNIQSEEAVIIGYTPPKGSRKGFGALLLGQYDKGKLQYIGNVGTGFTDSLLETLYKKFEAKRRPTTPLDVPVKVSTGTTWIEPVFVANIRFTEKTSEGILRHPVFAGLRTDKSAKEVTPEKALPVGENKPTPGKAPKKRKAIATKKGSGRAL